ncbi:MAG: cysteine--tRNA ligase [Patescibacteria group bacterium]|nr:cysteine--tRNA ligase [Patescibacteria group bacterium]
MLKLYNTLSKKVENFKPIHNREVGLYTCGPTVYNFAHIGNLRTYIFEDLLQRVLEYNGYRVNRAMNITDVGHLVSDADEGEDKLEVGAKREGKHPLEIARFYTDKFFRDLTELNIIKPGVVKSATQTIDAQIEIIKLLEQKDYTYQNESGIYFDTSKLPDYGMLSGQKLSGKKTGAREEVVVDPHKKHPQDFVLWFFLAGKYKNHVLHWPSPWGEGFPGWHIECSAISRKALGQPFDIHTGGVDHIGTHHTNEMAQSEAAFGVPLANIWMHGEFLQINSGKMAKSAGTFITLDDLKAKGFSPLDLRYLYLTAHYRTQLNFTWEGLEAAHKALERLYAFINLPRPGEDWKKEVDKSYQNQFIDAINYDLNIPKALGIARSLMDDPNILNSVKITTLFDFDKIFGLKLEDTERGYPTWLTIAAIQDQDMGLKLKAIMLTREKAREQKDFQKSDELRKQIEDLGYEVMDTPEGQKVKKKVNI